MIKPTSTSPNMAQPRLYQKTPNNRFFQAYMTSYASNTVGPEAGKVGDPAPTGAPASEGLLANLLGQVHTELSRRRDVSLDDQSAYAVILNRAYQEGGMMDPASFLGSLSTVELAVVQRNHGLADPISPGSLSHEGAYNLLLPEGYVADFNHDDLIEVGLASNLRFPPADAPQKFVDAWFKATQGMSEKDAAIYARVMFHGMHNVVVGDQPLRRLIPPDSMDSYQGLVTRILEWLENPAAGLAPGQYERDKAFFGRLQELMA